VFSNFRYFSSDGFVTISVSLNLSAVVVTLTFYRTKGGEEQRNNDNWEGKNIEEGMKKSRNNEQVWGKSCFLFLFLLLFLYLSIIVYSTTPNKGRRKMRGREGKKQ
jgi:uncharacterized membrane protein